MPSNQSKEATFDASLAAGGALLGGVYGYAKFGDLASAVAFAVGGATLGVMLARILKQFAILAIALLVFGFTAVRWFPELGEVLQDQPVVAHSAPGGGTGAGSSPQLPVLLNQYTLNYMIWACGQEFSDTELQDGCIVHPEWIKALTGIDTDYNQEYGNWPGHWCDWKATQPGETKTSIECTYEIQKGAREALQQAGHEVSSAYPRFRTDFADPLREAFLLAEHGVEADIAIGKGQAQISPARINDIAQLARQPDARLRRALRASPQSGAGCG
jgi:hypothetical protein